MLNSLFSRRQFLKTSTAGVAAGLIPSGLMVPPAFAAAATVGFIYVGPKDDYGYNQAHAEGAAAVKAHRGRHRGRGRERPRDRRRAEDHGDR